MVGCLKHLQTVQTEIQEGDWDLHSAYGRYDDESQTAREADVFWVLIKDVDSWQHRKGVHNSLPLALGYGVD